MALECTKHTQEAKIAVRARAFPESYPAGRDFKGYLDLLEQIDAGETTAPEAVGKLPNLSRVGGVCRSAVRWVT